MGDFFSAVKILGFSTLNFKEKETVLSNSKCKNHKKLNQFLVSRINFN